MMIPFAALFRLGTVVGISKQKMQIWLNFRECNIFKICCDLENGNMLAKLDSQPFKLHYSNYMMQ